MSKAYLNKKRKITNDSFENHKITRKSSGLSNEDFITNNIKSNRKNNKITLQEQIDIDNESTNEANTPNENYKDKNNSNYYNKNKDKIKNEPESYRNEINTNIIKKELMNINKSYIQDEKEQLRHLLKHSSISFGNQIEVVINKYKKNPYNKIVEVSKNYKTDFNPSHKYPWLDKSKNKNLFGTLKLHYEIIDFYNFIKPTKAEKENREKIFNKIKKIIQNEYENSKVILYGSCSYGLNLPESDMDILIIINEDDIKKNIKSHNNNNFNNKTKNEIILQNLSNKFLESKNFSYVEVIRARVPIIKCTFKTANLNIDISLNYKSALKSKLLTNQILSSYPFMRPLIYVVKYFLRQKNLNDSHTGGLSSFSIFNMIYFYILYYYKNEIKYEGDIRDLGKILVGFFNFYGFEVNYNNVKFSNRFGGFITEKNNGKNTLSFENPIDINNDLGIPSFKFGKIIDVFKLARDSLYYIEYEKVISYLGQFIEVNEKLLKRKEVLEGE
jgi:non-canonical poly(A) RNA polymerase PAPD5/7